MKRRSNILLAVVAIAAVIEPACVAQGPGWQPPPVTDFQQFASDVMPVLIRDCGFHTCHGSTQRFFRVWGPGRVRLDPNTRAFDGLTGNELSSSYFLAASMVDTRDPAQSLLLRKPLAREAGGAAHRGADPLGRNVYRTATDPGYVVLRKWVGTVTGKTL